MSVTFALRVYRVKLLLQLEELSGGDLFRIEKLRQRIITKEMGQRNKKSHKRSLQLH